MEDFSTTWEHDKTEEYDLESILFVMEELDDEDDAEFFLEDTKVFHRPRHDTWEELTDADLQEVT